MHVETTCDLPVAPVEMPFVGLNRVFANDKPRMICADCGITDHPDTLIEGSDIIEMIGWLCFAVPGWIYCSWRQALRIKACPHCGSRSLMREARAAAARRPWAAVGPSILWVANLSGPMRWPEALRSPRARLRHGSAAVALWLGAWLNWSVGIAGLSDAAWIFAWIFAVTGLGWFTREALRIERAREFLNACRAWDDRGRALHIEAI